MTKDRKRKLTPGSLEYIMRHAMVDQDMTGAELAKEIGVSRGMVSNYLSKPERMSVRTLSRIIKVLRLDPAAVGRSMVS